MGVFFCQGTPAVAGENSLSVNPIVILVLQTPKIMLTTTSPKIWQETLHCAATWSKLQSRQLSPVWRESSGPHQGMLGRQIVSDYMAMGVLEKVCEPTPQRAEIPQTRVGESLPQRLLEIVPNNLGKPW